MRSIIVIPARYGSTRFPGKPLKEITGRGMLHRTWAIARAVDGVDQVYVATDDDRIAEAARRFGADVVMTDDSCRNGSERVHQAVKKLGQSADVIVNLQADAVLTPPWTITELVRMMAGDASIRLGTLATQLDWPGYERAATAKASGEARGTYVVFDQNQRAMYFSKGLIPFLRNREGLERPPVYRHVGIYAYRAETLEEYLALEPTTLEITEGLEQLRALENGIPIHVAVVDYEGRTHWSVDTPEDLKMVESIIAREGELVGERHEGT